MDRLYIPILVGTVREQRKSIDAAHLIEQVGKTIEGIEVELVDPKDFTFPGDGNDPEGKDPRYTAIVTRADGFIIVTPEYNHSFPGTLKRMLDSELDLYTHKPVAFAGVSNGGWGGVRVIESLLSPVRTMGMVASFRDMQFPRVQDLFDDNDQLQDEAYIDRIKAFYEELIWMTKVLKAGRETIPSKFHQIKG
ncbi:MAG: NADPH-dependent reductase [Candidatus Saccharibacteria bacterium]|nr:NADPH-dependent reductase [Candidatus Saccharibacteria bacterium]